MTYEASTLARGHLYAIKSSLRQKSPYILTSLLVHFLVLLSSSSCDARGHIITETGQL